MAIRTFKNSGSEDINYGRNSKAARRLLPVTLLHKAQVKLARLSAAESLKDLQTLPGNHLELLKGNRKGQYSIRINEQYRICFKWINNNAEDVEVVDYH